MNMYKFCKVMFMLSVIGFVANVVLIFINKTNVYDYLRAMLMTVTSFSFLALMKIYKRKK